MALVEAHSLNRAQHLLAGGIQAAPAAVHRGMGSQGEADAQLRAPPLRRLGAQHQRFDLRRALAAFDVEVQATQQRRIVARDESFHGLVAGASEGAGLAAGGQDVAQARGFELREVVARELGAVEVAPAFLAAFASGKGPDQGAPGRAGRLPGHARDARRRTRRQAQGHVLVGREQRRGAGGCAGQRRGQRPRRRHPPGCGHQSLPRSVR